MLYLIDKKCLMLGLNDSHIIARKGMSQITITSLDKGFL